jgi:hypothetical protein
MTKVRAVLRKISALENQQVRFIFAEVENMPGQFAIMAQQGELNRIVIQADRQEMLLFVEAVVRDIREH